MRKQRKQCENIFSDFWPQATQYLAAGRKEIAEFFASGKKGLSHRNHRNHRNTRKDECETV